jgi:hypothetical protein
MAFQVRRRWERKEDGGGSLTLGVRALPRVHAGVSVLDAWPNRPVFAEHPAHVHFGRPEQYLRVFSLVASQRLAGDARVARRRRQGGGPTLPGERRGQGLGRRTTLQHCEHGGRRFTSGATAGTACDGGFGRGGCADDREPRLAVPAAADEQPASKSRLKGHRAVSPGAGDGDTYGWQIVDGVESPGRRWQRESGTRPAAAVGRQRERAMGEGGGCGIANISCIGVGIGATTQNLGRPRSLGVGDGEMGRRTGGGERREKTMGRETGAGGTGSLAAHGRGTSSRRPIAISDL